MKTVFTFICFLICFLPTHAQTVEWASEIIDYSSQFGPRQYAAAQVLGKPNVLPNLGASPSAWSPKKQNRVEYIHVGFVAPMKVRQIAIAETHNPGGISKIFAYDPAGNEYLINQFDPQPLPIEGRLFRLFIDETKYPVKSIKIVIDGSSLEGHFGIDAIGISGHSDPINVDINITDEINNDYIPIALGPEVNTSYNELRPLISPDAKTLFFSRRNHPENIGGEKDDEDIWLSVRDSATGDWTQAVNIGKPLNNKGPNFIESIQQRDDVLHLLLGNAYYSKNRMTLGVSTSHQLPDGSWDKPKNIEITNDYNTSEKANYFLSRNGKTMIAAVERKDTYGSRDFYVSFKLEDASWTEPVNMGDGINTADEEGSPFLASDDETLFFSSKGFSGYGGYDIYMTRRLDDTWQNWSEPENLGASFNSREDDIFFNFTENDEYAYFTRGSEENTDIYKVKLPYYQKPKNLALMGPEFQGPGIIISIIGKVFNSKTMEAIDASLQFIQVSEKASITLINSDLEGYNTTLPEDYAYSITANSEGFYNSVDSVSLIGITESTEIERNFYLDPIIKNEAIVLDNVYFDFDSDHIRSESYPELDKVSEMLLDNLNLDITIDGHTCSLGSDTYNQKLSQMRARAIARYVEAKGVVEDRVNYHGYGEAKPIATNETEEGREMNRRVEFKLSDSSEN